MRDPQVTIGLDKESVAALEAFSEATSKLSDWQLLPLLQLLLDVWVQFAIEKVDANGNSLIRWHGGLSVLEEVEAWLYTSRMIDDRGLAVER